MMYVLLLIGLLLPTLSGWLLLRIIEGKTAVLYSAERLVAGFAVGSIVSPFAWFLSEASGIGNFSLVSMLTVQLLLIAVFGALFMVRKKTYGLSPVPMHRAHWSAPQIIVGGVLGFWFVLKALSAYLLLIGPAYFDDTVKNWNLRGKMYFIDKELVLQAVPGKDVGIGSYPPTVPLMKAWLASVSGEWNEIIVNSIHILWFLAAIALLYFVLRRSMRSTWAALGAYMLSSLPLYMVHGGTAYADQFLSLSIFTAVSWLYLGLGQAGDVRGSFLRLSAIATGLLVFTKNEALLLHLPPIALILVACAVLGVFNRKELRINVLWYGGSVAAIALPWLIFKWLNGLTFGNAKSATGMLKMEWHEHVLETIAANNFMMAHWALLPILLVFVLIIFRSTAFRTTLSVCTAFFLVVFLEQIPLYVLTDLYVEALNQTGYARGILHIIPIAVLIIVTCLHRALAGEENSISQTES